MDRSWRCVAHRRHSPTW